jgi:hypothetical protein
MPKYKKLKTFAAKSDICRYAILYLNGGMYVDTDMECLRPFAHDLPSENDIYDMVASSNDTLTAAERRFLGRTNNCWFIARKGAKTLKYILDKFANWNGNAGDVLISTMKYTGPLAFGDGLKNGGDVVYDIPSRLLELGLPLTNCTIPRGTKNLRKHFPHSYAVHHMDGSWVAYKPSCFFTVAWTKWRDSVDVVAFTFGFIIAILLIVVLVLSVRNKRAVDELKQFQK